LAREGVAAMIEHLRCSGTAHNVGSTVHRAHASSIALLRALGFEHTSTRLNAELIRGVPTDEQEFWLRA
jgi:RimJ/RimL family protein N-acetyltransferase